MGIFKNELPLLGVLTFLPMTSVATVLLTYHRSANPSYPKSCGTKTKNSDFYFVCNCLATGVPKVEKAAPIYDKLTEAW